MVKKADLKKLNRLYVGLYIRVSTAEQAKEGYSIGEQLGRLEKYCEAMDWEIFKVYTDPGFSGGNTDRPALQEIIKDVTNGKLDKVVVYKLDRLSRSQLDTLYLIEKVFLANNTDFVSMSENFDTSTPFGRFMIGILAVFAQLEREQIKERMVMGREARAKEGKWGGGSTEPIGYDYNPSDDLLHVNKYEAIQINELYDLFLKGVPLRRIEKIFDTKGYKHKHGTWTAKTMRSTMRSKVTLGFIKYNDNWYKGEHTPIVDEERHRKALAILDERAELFKERCLRAGTQTSYLGGLIYCKHCGGKYGKVINNHGRPKVNIYYSCYSRSKKMKLMIKDPNCKNKTWRMDALDELVFNEIKKLSFNKDYIAEIRNDKRNNIDDKERIETIEKEIENINDQVSRFMDLYVIRKISIDAVTKKIEPLEEQKEKLTEELEKLKNEAYDLTEAQTLELVESFGESLDKKDFAETRAIIESLIDKIIIDDEKVFIHWKFA